MNLMTKKEAIEAYGDVPCSFASYFKFSFTFIATAEDGASITMSTGGNSDDIYRYEVKVNEPEYIGSANYIHIQKGGDVICDFFDPW